MYKERKGNENTVTTLKSDTAMNNNDLVQLH